MPSRISSPVLQNKFTRLLELVTARPGWVAFSGGVDSTLLLRAALEVKPFETVAVFADSPLQAEIDRENVHRLADGLGARLRIFQMRPLARPEFVANSPERCYLCKYSVYREFLQALPAGLVLMDGTNCDDDIDKRPGHRALLELAVETPLRAAGLGKDEIRNLALSLGLPNWDRPSSSCLATRIPGGTMITAGRLHYIERCETLVRRQGFGHIRVRPLVDDSGDLQVELAREEMAKAEFPQMRKKIVAALRELGGGRLDFVARDGVFVNKSS